MPRTGVPRTGVPRFDLEHAFARLYDGYRAPVARYFVRSFRSTPEVAEDLVHDTFVKVWRALPRYRPEHESGWIYQIAERVAIDHLRRQTFRAGPDWEAFAASDHPGLIDHGPGADPERDALAAERRRHVAATLARLPRHVAEVLVLYEYHGLSYTDLGARLGVGRPAVKSRLLRARSAFADRWPAVSGEAVPATLPLRDRRFRPGAGVYRRASNGAPAREARPWVAAPYDPGRRKQCWLGTFATEAQARAALAAWRARRAPEHPGEGAAA